MFLVKLSNSNSLRIDDLLIVFGPEWDRQTARRVVSELAVLLTTHGLSINVAKSQLNPVHQLVWNGLVWNTKSFSIKIPGKRLLRVRKSLQKTLKDNVHGRLQGLQLASTLGKMQACAEAVLPQRVYCREAMASLNKALAMHKGNYRGLVRLSGAARDDLRSPRSSAGPFR